MDDHAIISLILDAAADRAETAESPSSGYASGALETAGLALGAIYFSRTGEGMGIMEALDTAGDYLEKMEQGRYDAIDVNACATAFLKNINS